MEPIVAIIGRPNVGKSTLFNRIVGSRKALTLDTPGVTRDRNFALAEWGGREFVCVDTGGFPTESGTLDERVAAQIDVAIEESDIILCVFDGQTGLVPEERQIVDRLRMSRKRIFYAVNKIDQPQHESYVNDFYRLGIDKLFPVSGEHGYQVAELLDSLIREFPEQAIEQKSREEIQVAIVGRPNVGKSSLLNGLLGRPRVVVDSMPGTTRDSIDTPIHINGQSFCFIDTAGIRRRSQKGGHLEWLTVLQSFRAIDRAEVCLLILAADEGLLKQDAHIAGYIIERGRGLILLWNKMDLNHWKNEQALRDNTREALAFLPKVPLHFISVMEGKGLDGILPQATYIYGELGKRIATAKINKVFSDLVGNHHIPLFKGREVKLYYATQVGEYPPTFMAFSNCPAGVSDSYKRYLVHGLQKRLDLEQVPLRLVLRKRS